jgi:hypothetical protein
MALVIAILAGCMGGEEISGGGTRNAVRPGFYEDRIQASYNGTFLDVIWQTRFSGDNTYMSSAFLGSIEWIQTKGKWTHGGDHLFYTEGLTRAINDVGAWGPWEADPDNFDLVRNITETSYQYYYDFEKAVPAEERANFQGLYSGWRTCNRIGE